MRAAIIAVGSEMLGTVRLDTNSLKLAAALEAHGVDLRRKSVVGDSEDDLAREVARVVEGHDLVIVTGGLGPTADDVTRPAVARALGRGIEISEELAAGLIRRFAAMGIPMPEVNRRQAEVIDGARVLENPRGSAPGLYLEYRRPSGDGGVASLFLFPGVPGEMVGMIENELVPWLRERTGGAVRERAVLKVACVPESTLEEMIAPAYAEFGREDITVLAGAGDIELHVTAVGPAAERRARLEAMSRRLAELVGHAVYARESIDLEEAVGRALRDVGATVGTAESCTGGLVAERLTRVAGSSDYFLGALVTYSNELKERLLGVPRELLAEHGAVSEPVALAMARGARERLGTDYALALTGVAGPGGGSDEKPVGTVHVALAGPPEGPVGAGRDGGPPFEMHRKVTYPTSRERVRLLSSQVALEMLRRRLAKLSAAAGEGGA